MWEIFTNGDHPYKELENEDLAEYLRQGERLGKPDMAWSEMYVDSINSSKTIDQCRFQ